MNRKIYIAEYIIKFHLFFPKRKSPLRVRSGQPTAMLKSICSQIQMNAYPASLGGTDDQHVEFLSRFWLSMPGLPNRYKSIATQFPPDDRLAPNLYTGRKFLYWESIYALTRHGHWKVAYAIFILIPQRDKWKRDRERIDSREFWK